MNCAWCRRPMVYLPPTFGLDQARCGDGETEGACHAPIADVRARSR